MEGLSERIFRFVTARSPKFETPDGKPLPAGDSYRPKETALCETGRFFFGSTGPSERFALILSGIGGLLVGFGYASFLYTTVLRFGSGRRSDAPVDGGRGAMN